MNIGAISLGCDKNRVDIEKLLFKLVQNGHQIVSDVLTADFLLINTCAFTEDAKKESIDTIFEFAKYKDNKKLKIIVMGCLAQRYGQQLDVVFPEVDYFLGLGKDSDILDIISGVKKERIYIDNKRENLFTKDRVITTPPHYAYLKVSDGCNSCCAFCAIPSIRGEYRSYRLENLVDEGKALLDKGVKELIIVAQDTTRYGLDLYGEKMISPLLKSLSELGFYKIRLMYLNPDLIDQELIELIAYNDSIAKYLDIPIQHIDDTILKSMNRKMTGKRIRNVLEMINRANEKIAIRSSFIVGFPGEADENFLELVKFINEEKIDYAGFFPYSREEGTRAYSFSNLVPKKQIRERLTEITEVQARVVQKKQQKYIKTIQSVIYEGIDYERQLFYGRNEYNAPDIDTKIFFSSSEVLEIGEIYNVQINTANFDLFGKHI